MPSPSPLVRRGGKGLASFLLIGCVLGWPARAHAQSSANVTISGSEQLFCVMAALNAAGYDTGLFVNTGDDTRQQARSILAKENIPVLSEVRKFYQEHRIADSPKEELGQYISLALLLGPPPQFSFSIPVQDLPPDAQALKGFVPLLKTFYQQAGVAKLYDRLHPNYLQVIERYAPAVRQEIVLTDGYLRFPSATYLGRYYRIYMCLLGAPNQVQARIYRDNYYLVITPSIQPQFKYIRRQYLHFLLDPLAVKYGGHIHQKASLLHIARQAPALSQDFKNDFSFLLTECLIRAIELRMDHSPGAQATLQDDLDAGLILTPYFYSQLGQYEKQDTPMSDYFDQMVQGINVGKMENELASVKFSVPKPAATRPAAAPAVSAQDSLLNQGDNLIYSAQYGQAKQIFEEVLKRYDPKSERALYGLAVAASNTGEPDIAVKYFKQTLAVAHDLRIVTWSHIYLGRIYDLE
ncbi:MAG: tetratricopeptide repeat protein, partial [Terriglobia bacterium]